MSLPPEFHVNTAAFWEDPYPDYAAMRTRAPIAYVPELDAILFTKRQDIFVCEKNIAVFSSDQPQGLMTTLMGQNMMRKDGAAHQRERKQMFPSLSPVTVRDHWRDTFTRYTHEILEGLAERREADLVSDYSMPVSANALREITGLTSMSAAEMDGASQAMIDGCANYAGDADVKTRCHRATALIDAAIDQRLPDVEQSPDMSILSILSRATQPLDNIRANIKLTISGGQNEPRDAIAGTTWALLKHPQELARVRAGEVSWLQAFEEYARWISPIGMSPRRVAATHTYKEIEFEPERRVFFMFGAANRDEDVFDEPARFDVTRNNAQAITFGAGPHFCAGAAASRCLIAEVALPLLFAKFPKLRLAGDVRFRGWAFRGPLELPVRWD